MTSEFSNAESNDVVTTAESRKNVIIKGHLQRRFY